MLLKSKHIKLVTISLFVFFLLTACSFTMKDDEETFKETEPTTVVDEQEESTPEPVYITISAVGDVMAHMSQINAQYRNDIDDYDFTNNFKHMKPYITDADIALANLETTFGGAERGYSGFPLFNAPDALADGLADAGFDIIATANNHTIDTGITGANRTIDVLRDRDLGVIGTRKSVDEESYMIKDVNGVKVGFTAYTYETKRQGETKTLNGIPIPKDYEDLIDTFSYEYMEQSYEEMENRVNHLREAGAEAIVFFMHWGDEYQRQPNQFQKMIAQKLSEFGVDIIFGSHPHVVQPIELIKNEVNDHQTVVVYSMGNFISNQRHETLNNRYTEDGLMVTVELKKDFEEDTISINNVKYMPTWVYRYTENGRFVYEVIPVLDYIENKQSYELSDEIASRILNSKENTKGLVDLEDELLRTKPVFKRN
ncbi:CapA family protein [Serpentinicella sp. ANB-PHB4]|uniref:CapA family protein n=1 Tax=Serpentinicella sp. ANB-PHB4 TaxID=3074076 RepID=UPI002863CCE9|nr:CapA family protein [Serpentinicella sp. ANB-PHB4]MDR5659425.1 CapA family protein [Serpentinicella sp. ANB-PHB4]